MGLSRRSGALGCLGSSARGVRFFSSVLLLSASQALANEVPSTASTDSPETEKNPQSGDDLKDSIRVPEVPKDVESGRKRISISQAITATLAQNPDIRLQQAVVAAQRGAVRAAEGQFDVTVNATAGVKSSQTQMEQLSEAAQGARRAVGYTFGATKEFENGMSVTPSVTTTQQIVASTQESGTQSEVSFSIEVPLLRGLGVDAVTGQLQSDRASLKEEQYQLLNTIESQITTTTTAYWAVIAAEQRVVIQRQSEARSRQLIGMTKALIQGSLEPEAALSQPLANLAQATANRIQAQQSLVSATQQLAQALGLPPSEVMDAPLAADPLPFVHSFAEISQDDIKALVRLGIDRRHDLLAADANVQVQRALVPAMQNALLPELDLTVSAGLDGVALETKALSTLLPLNQPDSGPVVTAELQFEWPVENNAARGALVSQLAAVREALAQRQSLASQVASDVVTAVNAYMNAIKGFQQASKATHDYVQSLEDQRVLYQMGETNIVNVITTEQSLSLAQLSQVEAQVNFANAIVNLRYATGTLLPSPTDVYRINVAELARLPPIPQF